MLIDILDLFKRIIEFRELTNNKLTLFFKNVQYPTALLTNNAKQRCWVLHIKNFKGLTHHLMEKREIF